MKRRDFLAAAGLSPALAAPALAQAAPRVTWRMASSYPKSLDTIYGAADRFVRLVSAATGGQFEIQLFAVGELVPALSVATAVMDHTVEMGHTASYFYSGKNTAFAVATGLPWGLNARQSQAWLHERGGNDLLNAFFAEFGLYHLPAGSTGTQMAGWFRREIKGIADLNGLIMRIGGLGGNLLQRMGVVPQQLGAGDIFAALEKGVIDAAEFVGPYDDEKLGFAKIAPYYYFPGFWEGSSELSFFIDAEKWASLPPDYQEVLRMASRAAGAEQLARYDARNPEALRRLVAAGAQLREMPAEILSESHRLAQQMYAEMSGANPDFKTLYDSVKAFQDESGPYWQITDLSFDLAVARLRQGGGN